MATTRLSLRPLVFLVAACYGGTEPLGESFGESFDDATTFTSNVSAAPEESTSAGEPSTGEQPAPTTGEVEETSSSSSSTSGEVTSIGETTSSTGSGTTGEEDPLAECPRLRVMVPGEVLNVRPTPATTQAPIAVLADGALVDTVSVVTDGETIDGNSTWYEIASPSGFVFSGFVACTFDEPPPPPEGFFLPLQCGVKTKVTQGNSGNVSHQGKDLYAFDLGVGLGTPLVPMADGVVQHIYDKTKPGDPCYNGGGPECGPYGNLVVILHGDNTSTYYKHLSEVHVTVGQQVDRAHVMGLSGTTGYSTGPHAHVMRQENCGAQKCQSIPLSFIEAGVPTTGQFVTSQNCP